MQDPHATQLVSLVSINNYKQTFRVLAERHLHLIMHHTSHILQRLHTWPQCQHNKDMQPFLRVRGLRFTQMSIEVFAP